MKKNILFFFFQSFLYLFSLAQTDSLSNKKNNKMSLSFAIGKTIPEGAFEVYVDDKTGNRAGAASFGYYGKLDFHYLIHKKFGVVAMLYSSLNNSITIPYNQYHLPSSTGLGGGFIITSKSYDSKNWKTNGVLIGLYATKVKKLMSINFNLTAGIQQVKSPETHIYYTGYNWIGGTKTGTFSSVITQPSLYSYNIVLDFGIDWVVALSPIYKVKFGIENFFSQATFDGKLKYNSETNNIDGSSTTNESQIHLHFTKNVLMFGLNAGIIYTIK